MSKGIQATRRSFLKLGGAVALVSTLDPTAEAAPVPKNGYTYVVKAGDTLEAIVKAYGQNGVKVTVDQVLKANPKLKPNAMSVKQKIFIPDAAAP